MLVVVFVNESLEEIVREGDVSNFNILVAPFVEEFDAALLGNNVFGQDGVTRDWVFDFDLAVVGHLDEFGWWC